VADSLWLHKSFRDVMLKKIADAPLKGKKYVYSCLNFILLQQLVEQLAGVPMDEFLTREFYRPMNLSRTAYLPLRYFRKENIVPSSVDRFLRKETLQGFVHDESAAFLGGISGNAGLFSTAYEVSQVYQMLLNGGEYEGQRYLSKETCQLFTTETSKISRRGLGFDKPDAEDVGSSPCAPSAPASVYGHTGFTGTCAWTDPDNGLVYVFLSNRTYPDAWVNKLSNLEIREHIQETLYRALMQPAPVE
jgi:CubicO group peptidase (beta-lactamase class C family)